MGQLVDLEHVLNAAKEIGENFQKELDALRTEKEALQVKIDSLNEENRILREENEKIYIEMQNLRSAKDELRVANESFANNLNQLVTQLEDTHAKTMTDINQLLNDGLQKFVIEYVNKMRGETNNDVSEVQVVNKYSTAEIVVEDENLPAVPNAPKSKMQYAAFYAEENIDKDNAEEIRLSALPKPNKN